jgi:type III restriction enzyme
MFRLKDFQKTVVEQLSLTFLTLWKTEKYRLPLIFKAPTGSGKTIMMAEFLRCLDDNYQFNEDKAYLWVSFGGDESYMQSKKKLHQYFNEGTDMNLKDVNNLSEGKLYKNNIFFINWSKIKGADKDSKKLRKPNEHTEGEFGIFDEFIQKTKKERDLVLIIDEAHTETNTTLANEVIDLIDPRIILKVTATPKDEKEIKALAFDKKAGFVEALEEEVIKSGLIKEKIIIQTEEEIHKLENKNLSEDEIMLELALNKRLELKKLYEDLNLDINPLILIQLPSDEKEKEEVASNKKDVVLSYLMKKGVKESEIAIWLSNEKKNLELIEKNINGVNFMIFKVAPATGWDCPRADILVMFREISNPSFHTQIIGRIKRMPEGRHYKTQELNKAYIYTNYNKSHIKDVKDVEMGNKIPIHFTKLKEKIQLIQLETILHHRTDFNTLAPPPLWQMSCIKSLHNYFGTSDDALKQNENYQKVNEKIDLSQSEVSNQIIVDAQIESFDNFINEIKEKGKNIEYHLSNLDIERFYNLLCFKEIEEQGLEEAKYSPSRSFGALKKALNVYFGERVGIEREKYYKIIVNELLNPNSELKKAIQIALIEFRKTYDQNQKTKERKEKETLNLPLPEKEISFTDDFEEIQTTKNAYEKFYIRKSYKGKENETKFIEFLDSQDLDWWHKQEDRGRNVFAIEYFDSQEKKSRLFYPDFIIKKDGKVYLIDTKSGNTAKSQETADKNQALQRWIMAKEDKYDFEIIGGIADFKYPSWRINKKESYIYENISDWENLEF